MTYRIAIGTVDEENITEHFGQCSNFRILDISQEEDTVTFVENRITDLQEACGTHQDIKIREKIEALNDCHLVLVKQIGVQSEKLLTHYGIVPLQNQGSINQALKKIRLFYKKHQFNRG